MSWPIRDVIGAQLALLPSGIIAFVAPVGDDDFLRCHRLTRLLLRLCWNELQSSRSGSSSNDVLPGRDLLEETKRMQRDAQNQRTRERIGNLFLPVRRHLDSRLLEEIRAKHNPVVPAPPSEVKYHQSNVFDTFLSVPYSDEDVAHRGKWYAVRRGRQTGVFPS
jgi:hypothetical protein